MADLQAQIEELWGRRAELGPDDADAVAIVREAIDQLDGGEIRAAELDGATDQVVVNVWVKQAILLLFRLSAMETVELGPFEYADRIPLKHGYAEAGVRVVPGASARWGSYLERGVVMMPSYVNIGARVGANTMVDTWATVGSCAQVGANVHLSGGVGIGGVLEPPQAAPVIVEDDVLIGSPSVSRHEQLITDHLAALLAEVPWLEVTRWGNNLVARTHLGRPLRLILAGHSDTVPPNGNERARLEGDVLWGLGATDMKSGLAVILELARTVPEPAVDVTYVFYE